MTILLLNMNIDMNNNKNNLSNALVRNAYNMSFPLVELQFRF